MVLRGQVRGEFGALQQISNPGGVQVVSEVVPFVVWSKYTVLPRLIFLYNLKMLMGLFFFFFFFFYSFLELYPPIN